MREKKTLNTDDMKGLKLALTQFYSDLYMRRNFKVLQDKLDPDVILFLGDIMDGGREWKDLDV